MNETVLSMDGLSRILEIGKGFTKSGLVLTVLFAIIIFLLAKSLTKMVNRMLKKAVDKHGKDAQTSYNFINKVLEVLIYGFAIVLILNQFTAFDGVSTLFAAGASVFGVAAALASQESMSNFIGGMFLAIMQPFKVGDLIVISDKNISGTVTDIGLRHTTIKTFDNTEMIIPNSIMNTAVIENKSSATHYTVRLVFGISYDSDIKRAMEIMREHAENHPNMIDIRTEKEKADGIPAVAVSCVNLGDFSVDLRVNVHTRTAAEGTALSSDLRISVKEAFEKEGINIPFPTMQIHTETSQK